MLSYRVDLRTIAHCVESVCNLNGLPTPRTHTPTQDKLSNFDELRPQFDDSHEVEVGNQASPAAAHPELPPPPPASADVAAPAPEPDSQAAAAASDAAAAAAPAEVTAPGAVEAAPALLPETEGGGLGGLADEAFGKQGEAPIHVD